MIVNLRADHFKGKKFQNGTCCPIATAIKETFGVVRVVEGVNEVVIDGVRFDHEPYQSDDFEEDSLKAADFCFSRDVIIRRIQLSTHDNNRAMDTVQEPEFNTTGSLV